MQVHVSISSVKPLHTYNGFWV